MHTAAKLRLNLPNTAFFTKIDVSDAFLHCPLHPQFHKFVAFSMNGELYFFRAMPFGLNIAPLIYTRLSKFPLSQLHEMGITCSAYMDDWIIWGQSEAETKIFHAEKLLTLFYPWVSRST